MLGRWLLLLIAVLGEAETTDSLTNYLRPKRPHLKKQGKARLVNEQLRLFSGLHMHCYPNICMHIGTHAYTY